MIQKIQKIAIDKINLKSSKNNLLYFPFRREVKLDLLMNTINNFSNKIYMPRIFLNKDMKFNLLSKIVFLELINMVLKKLIMKII